MLHVHGLTGQSSLGAQGELQNGVKILAAHNKHFKGLRCEGHLRHTSTLPPQKLQKANVLKWLVSNR